MSIGVTGVFAPASEVPVGVNAADAGLMNLIEFSKISANRIGDVVFHFDFSSVVFYGTEKPNKLTATNNADGSATVVTVIAVLVALAAPVVPDAETASGVPGMSVDTVPQFAPVGP